MSGRGIFVCRFCYVKNWFCGYYDASWFNAKSLCVYSGRLWKAFGTRLSGSYLNLPQLKLSSTMPHFTHRIPKLLCEIRPCRQYWHIGAISESKRFCFILSKHLDTNSYWIIIAVLILSVQLFIVKNGFAHLDGRRIILDLHGWIVLLRILSLAGRWFYACRLLESLAIIAGNKLLSVNVKRMLRNGRFNFGDYTINLTGISYKYYNETIEIGR